MKALSFSLLILASLLVTGCDTSEEGTSAPPTEISNEQAINESPAEMPSETGAVITPASEAPVAVAESEVGTGEAPNSDATEIQPEESHVEEIEQSVPVPEAD